MLAPATPGTMPFDQFRACLQSACGAFDVLPEGNRSTVTAHVSRARRAGFDMTMIGKDVRGVRRSAEDVARNPGNDVFLIVQEEGQALMQQDGRATLMRPGDMILIDGTLPSQFTFFGAYMRHLSVHLDRTEFCRRVGGAAFAGHSLRASEYGAAALAALIGKALGAGECAIQAGYLREAVFGVLGTVLHDGGWRRRCANWPG
ncbi:AraC-like ligand-binding domain-containing protein [Mangrovicoccus ximenensis]|uniref:AraC-like ligand-binding domain-containing protein n=1 Tax=Mangrovicoccus ximenensis TaxID=1911570 RepID=UPI000D3764A7|nr:hypothetical protein [Mangrovicoccus ximenensis]